MACDILITALPVSALNYAPAAPALLKACVEEAGFTAHTLDLSQSFLMEQSNSSFDQYDRDSSCLQPNVTVTDLTKINLWLDSSIEKIRKINPKYIGLSIFSYFMHRSAFLLAERLRDDLPNIKIILGGFGATQPASSLDNLRDFKKSELIKPFNKFMSDRNLSDYNIIGEGEDKLVSLLLQEERKMIQGDDKLYKVPMSDFTDYDLENYNYISDVVLPITGSKGCVRQCTFCDIPNKFGRFRYRSGKDIAEEIMLFKDKYGISNFSFTDSLINGSLSALEELVIELADYNNKNPNNRITWTGQYISRPMNQTPERIYDLMAQSGATGLTIGLESGSNDVLEAMNKKVKIEDVDWEMEKFEKYGISTVLLLIIGFYNETYENFLETIDTIVRYQKYVASGTIIRIDLGHPLLIHSETALFDNAHQLGIKLDDVNPYMWTAENNPGLTFKERVRRRLIAQIACDELGIPTGMTAYNLKSILDTVNEQTREHDHI